MVSPSPALAATLERSALARVAVAWGVPLAVAVGVIVNAAGGLMPGVGFWDTGEFQTILPILGTAHPTGYPTYVLLGFVLNILLTPLGEPAFRITVLSLLAIATAAGVTVALVRRLTGSTVVGAAAGLGLALTPIVWENATRADPHPLHLAFVAVLLLLLVTWEQRRRAGRPDADRWLVASAVVFGLAAGNHSLTLLLAPPIGLFVVATEPGIVKRFRLIATCVLALAVTLVLVYLELPLRAGIFRAPLVYAQPDTWSGFWYIALAEQFRGSLVDPLGDLSGKLGQIVDLAAVQFGVLAVLVPVGFLATVRLAPRYALLTGTAMVITLIFDTSYANADIERYYLGPILWAWTWLGVLGGFVLDLVTDLVTDLVRRRPEDAAATGRPTRTAGAVAVAIFIALLVPGIGASAASRQQADRSTDTSAVSWLDETLAAVAPNSVIVSWWTTSTPLWYAQDVEGLRPDIFVVDDRTMLDQDLGGATDVIAKYLGQRPVYVIRAYPQDLEEVAAQFEIQPVLNPDGSSIGSGSTQLYQVTGRVPGA